MHELDWFDARSHLTLGAPVRVRVRAVRDARRFRFPVELELVSPDLGHILKEAAPPFPAIVVYEDADDGLEPEELARQTGRPWPPPRSPAEVARSDLMSKVGAVHA